LILLCKSDSRFPEVEIVMARFDLSDEEWAIIAPLLPKQGRGPERRDVRKILNGMFYMFYILRTGAP
jgi:transposase